MKKNSIVMFFSTILTTSLMGMEKEKSSIHTFCTIHAPFHLAQLEKEYKKIPVTDLNSAFINKYIAAVKALTELKKHTEEKEIPKTNLRQRALSDSQKRTIARGLIGSDNHAPQPTIQQNLSSPESDSSDTSDSDSDSLSSISDSEEEIHKVDKISNLRGL